MKKNNLKVFFVATEQSGDNLGSELMKQFNSNIYYNFDFCRIGGDLMINEGLCITNHLSEFKSIGFIEIIKNLKSIFSILNKNVYNAIKFKPDLIITIDSPDFSFRFVKKLKNNKVNSKFIHYVAPTVWAWRPWRAKYISGLYDLLLTIFPFENKYFEKYGLKTTFIGNPICNFCLELSMNKKREYIGLLPGSRLSEINSLFPYYKSLNDYININYPKYRVFMPTLPYLKNSLKKLTFDWKIKPIITDDKREIEEYLSKCKISIVCSGTATLEMLIKKIPIIVTYKLNIFTEILFSLFVKTKFANIINIIAKKEIVFELTNHNLTKKRLIKKFDLLFRSNILQEWQILESQKIIKSLCLKNSNSFNACNEILKII